MNFPHPAPWGRTLQIITVAVCLLLAGVWSSLWIAPAQAGVPRLVGLVLLPAMILVAALFVVRGFEIRAGELRIRRLLWWTTIPLDGLQNAVADPKATGASIRIWGNGGFFAFSGWFANRKLGRYRLFATDVPRSVVLTFANRRPVVVTPARPARFIEDIRAAAGLPTP